MEEQYEKQADSDKHESHESQQQVNQSIQKIVTENPDSIEIGSASKNAKVKIYGDFDKLEDFKKKIDNAVKVRKYAIANIAVNI